MQPQMNTDEHRLNATSETIIGCAFTVANTLGQGYLEKVYENALAHEIRLAGLEVEQQKGLAVHYKGVVVGEYCTDLVVAGCVLVELKAAKALDDAHVAQCLNYLTATGLPLCLLLNFGEPKVKVKRLRNKSYLC
jgi:GxxExxY protein